MRQMYIQNKIIRVLDFAVYEHNFQSSQHPSILLMLSLLKFLRSYEPYLLEDPNVFFHFLKHSDFHRVLRRKSNSRRKTTVKIASSLERTNMGRGVFEIALCKYAQLYFCLIVGRPRPLKFSLVTFQSGSSARRYNWGGGGGGGGLKNPRGFKKPV